MPEDHPGNGNKFVLQLNLPALERLLGGDAEAEVQLRHQIVEEFAKKHLRQVTATAEFHRAVDAVETAVRQEVAKLLGEGVYDDRQKRYVFQLPHDFRQQIETRVKDQARAAVDEAVRAATAVLKDEVERDVLRYEGRLLAEVTRKVGDVLAKVDAAVDARVDEKFEERVQAEVRRRLEAAAKG